MGYDEQLTQTCTVRRATSETVSGSGEVTKNYTDYATEVPCLVQIKSGGIVRWEFGESVEANAMGYFLAAAEIIETDKIVVDGTEYDVLFVEDVRGHHKEAYLSRGVRKR